MKKYFILILTCIALLAFFGCDRFEHTFEADSQDENWISSFFAEFADSIATFPENIPGIMTFYHDSYSNNGSTKADVEDFFISFTIINTPVFLEATLIDTTTNLDITWQLIATTTSKEVILDTTFVDVLIPAADSYLYYGNQVDLRNILVELFTGQWCSNCPNAEEALHNLRAKYGSRFSYVEYHIADQMAIDENNTLFSYYPNSGTVPFAIVNGNLDLIYTAATVECVQNAIETAIADVLQQAPPAIFSDLQYTIADTSITGSISIQIEPGVPTEELHLVAVLLEDYNAEYTNYNGVPHHNIALKRSSLDLSNHDLQEPVQFAITDLNDLASLYNGILPDDLTLVLWLQTLTSPYDQQTCRIYNIIETPILQN